MNDRSLRTELARALPDLPRWCEARGLLLSGRGEVLLAKEGKSSAGYFVIDRERPLVCAVHRPVANLVSELFERYPERDEILAPLENARSLRSLLPGWIARPATVHLHPDPARLPGPEHRVRFLGADEEAQLEGLPPELAAELSLALQHGPVAASFVDERPAAFCYAAYETETWWDVSVDTLEEHRRQGLASSAAAFMSRYMLERNKKPVWGALDANEASLALAAKHGFRAIDRLVVFTPPE